MSYIEDLRTVISWLRQAAASSQQRDLDFTTGCGIIGRILKGSKVGEAQMSHVIKGVPKTGT
jgi:hypothetical protein